MQTKLQECTLLGNGFLYNSASNMEEFEKCQYGLKKLSLRRTIKHRMLDRYFPTKLNENNMLEFLKTQAATVEQLTLYRTFSVPIYKSIFMNFKNLKSIQILMDMFPVENIAPIFSCRPICSVKDLVVIGKLENYDACRGIFSVFPNVEKLVVDNSTIFDNNILLLMSTMLPKVDSLHLSKVDDSLFKECTFGALKTLQIHEIKNLTHVGLTRMTKCNPTIESLSIKLMDPQFNLIFDIIARNLVHLKVLKLGRGFYPTQKVAKDIKNKCQNLRVLKIADYFAKNNEIVCDCVKYMSFCMKKAKCNTCHVYTISKYNYTEANQFDMRSHIDHKKIRLVTFNLSILSLTSEFAINNILEHGKYEDEIEEHSSKNLMNDTEWSYWTAVEDKH